MDIEIWKPMIYKNIEWNYEISNLGNIRIKKTKKLRKLNIHDYITITLFLNNKPQKFFVHVLIAIFFVPNNDINKRYVNHINYNKHDNRATNLEWVTHQENCKHACKKIDRKTNKKIVLRYELDNNNNIMYDTCKEYESIKTILDDGFGKGVYKCLSNKIQSYNGYYWIYKYEQSHKIPLDKIDVSTFKEIANLNNYLISNDGKIYNKKRQAFLIPQIINSTFMLILEKNHIEFTAWLYYVLVVINHKRL